MTWNHAAVYEGLGSRHGSPSKALKDRYVYLWPQTLRCALLYSPDSPSYQASPLHLNDSREGWRTAVFAAIEPVIQQVGEGNNKGWKYFRVLNWAKFAEGLGL